MKKFINLDMVRDHIKEHVDLQEAMEHYGADFVQVGPDDVGTLCLFHEDTNPSLAVSKTKQVYHCYGCKESGDVFTLVEKLESVGHIQAIRKIAQIFGLDLSQFERAETPEEKRISALYQENEKVAQRCMEGSSSNFVDWILRRGFDELVLEKFGIGYSSSLPRSIYSEDLGLDRRFQWKDVVVVPLRDEYGRTVGFRNRPLAPDAPKSIGPSKNHPLPLPYFYGFHEAREGIRSNNGEVVLVEGEADVWRMHEYGWTNTIAMQGTKFSSESAKWLQDRGIRTVYVLPDADKAGATLARSISKKNYGSLVVKIATLPDGMDPDDALLADPDFVLEAITGSVYGIEYLVCRSLMREVYTESDKVDILHDLAEEMADVTPLQEEVAAKILAEELGFDVASIIDHFREDTGGEASLHDPKAELSVLSNCMDDTDSGQRFCGHAVMNLEPRDFYLRRNQIVFTAIKSLYVEGDPVKIDTVAVKLSTMGHLDVVEYARTLSGGYDSSGPFMVEVVKEKSKRRQMSSISKAIMSQASNMSVDVKSLTQRAMSDISHVVVGGNEGLKGSATLVNESMEKILERAENPNVIVGMDLGREWQTLNRTIHGFQRDRYMVFSGPSGSGKTAAAVQVMLKSAVDHDIPTLVLTFETGPEVMTQRALSNISGVPQEKMSTGFLNDEELDLISTAAAQIGGSPFKITQSGRTLEEALAIIRHDVLVRGTETVVLDYVQLMEIADNRGISRHQELALVSRGLLEITQELNLRTLAIAQLNREGAKKKGAADHTDIGEGFRLAQDADIFIVYAEKSEEAIEIDGPQAGNRRLIVTKNRKDGPTGVGANMQADLEVQRITEVPS